MRTALALCMLGMLLFLTPAQAEDAFGRVRAIYYEAAQGVLVDARLLKGQHAVRWADVDVQGRMLLVQMPADLRAGIGDLVGVRLGAPKSTELAQLLPALAVNRAIEVNPPQVASGANASTGR